MSTKRVKLSSVEEKKPRLLAANGFLTRDTELRGAPNETWNQRGERMRLFPLEMKERKEFDAFFEEEIVEQTPPQGGTAFIRRARPGFVVDLNRLHWVLRENFVWLVNHVSSDFPPMNTASLIFDLNQVSFQTERLGAVFVSFGDFRAGSFCFRLEADCVVLECLAGRFGSLDVTPPADKAFGGPLEFLKLVIVPEKEALKPRRKELDPATGEQIPPELLDIVSSYETFSE